jgi:hypothetical protein
MSPINGQTATFSRDEQRARSTGGHPPVVVAGLLTANDGIYPVGLVLKRGGDGITWVQAEEGDPYIGVLDTTVDTGYETSGVIVIHGSVNLPVLKIDKTAQTAPTQADIIALQSHGIFPS